MESKRQLFQRRCFQLPPGPVEKVLRKVEPPEEVVPLVEGSRRLVKSISKETCTDPSCNFWWHSPGCQNRRTEEGCSYGEKCFFYFQRIVNSQTQEKEG